MSIGNKPVREITYREMLICAAVECGRNAAEAIREADAVIAALDDERNRGDREQNGENG